MSVYERAGSGVGPLARPRQPLSSEREAHRLRARSLQIVGTYLAVAALWILFSDRALELAVSDPDDLVRYGSYKGLAFVFVTAALLLGIIRQSFDRTLAAYREYEANDVARVAAFALAEQERRFSEAMIDTLPGIVYLYDSTGEFLRWNRNFEEVTGRSAAEIATMHPLEFFRPSATEDVEARIAEVFAGGEVSIESDLVHRDGTATRYFLTGRQLLFDDRTCLVGVGIDITERIQAERALMDAHTALVQAEAADQVKSSFLATMSHELRTPLNSIIGFTGIVLQGLAGPLTEEQAKQLRMVRTSARHLLELINDVLDLSKIEAGQLEVRASAFDLGESVAQVLATVGPLADQKGLALTWTIPEGLPTMVADRRRVEQVLLNLVSNAIKFTDRGGVEVAVEVVDGRLVRLRVRDTGIGIRPDQLAELFRPFRQVDTGLDRRHDGTGLGLAISQQLCALMGGTIEVVSSFGSGSEFTVTLPLDERSSP